MANAKTPSEHALTLSMVIKEAAPGAIKRLQGEFGKLNGVVELVANVTKQFANVLKETVGPAGAALIGTLASAGLEIMKLDDMMARTGLQFGMSRAEVDKMNVSLYKSAAAAGIQADQLFMVSKNLIEADFKGSSEDLLKLSETVFKFSEVTGASISEVSAFAGGLSKLGINADMVIKGLATLRANLQLSTKEFSAVLEVTKFATEAMYAYGNSIRSVSDTDLANFAKEVGKTSAVMQALGVSAETSTKLLKGMIDPQEWMGNQRTMMMLGYSLDDVENNLSGVNGTLGDTGATLRQLRDRMQQFTSGSIRETMAWSETLGIPATQMRIIAKMTDEEIAKKEALAIENRELDEIWKNMGDTLTSLQRSMSRLFGTFFMIMKGPMEVIGKTVNAIAGALSTITNFITGAMNSLGKFGEYVGQVFSGVVAGAIMLGVGIVIAWFGKAIAGAMQLGNAIFGVGTSSTQAMAGVDMLGASVSRLGINFTTTTAAMTQYIATQKAAQMMGGGVGALTGKVSAANTAALMALPLPTIGMGGGGNAAQPIVALEKVAAEGGAKFGGTFMTAIGKKMGWIGVGLAAVSVISSIGKKSFSLNDLGTMLLSYGPMLAMIPGWGLAGAGIAMALGALILGVGKMSGFGSKNWFGETQNVAQNSNAAANISKNQEDIIDWDRLEKQLKDDDTNSILRKVADNTSGTHDTLKEGNRISKEQARVDNSMAYMENMDRTNVGNQTAGR